MNRRTFLAAGAGLAAGVAADGLAVEPADVHFTEHQVNGRRGDAERQIVVAQVSDLHIHRVGPMHRRIAAEVNARKPDVVLITGDLIDRAVDLPVAEEFLALLDSPAPRFAVLGNWEHWCGVDVAHLREMYERHGCRLLVNETAVVESAGRRIAVTGLDDLEGTPDLARALRDTAPADGHVLMAHSPAWRDRMEADARGTGADRAVPGGGVDLASYAIDVVLSGHSHGGQVAAFGWAPLLPPGVGRYVRGWFRDMQPPLFVSRGIGTSVLPVRLGSPPEIAFHRLWA